MRITLNIDESSATAFEAEIKQQFEAVKSPAQDAMTQRFFDIVQSNFGIAGPDRPWAWDPLKPSTIARYRKIGINRTYASLELTGRLKASVMKQNGVAQGTVSMSDADVPYATSHHEGTSNMAARRVFPVDQGGEVMPWTQGQCVEAATKAIENLLK